jgi:hypothetical protein
MNLNFLHLPHRYDKLGTLYFTIRNDEEAHLDPSRAPVESILATLLHDIGRRCSNYS